MGREEGYLGDEAMKRIMEPICYMKSIKRGSELAFIFAEVGRRVIAELIEPVVSRYATTAAKKMKDAVEVDLLG